MLVLTLDPGETTGIVEATVFEKSVVIDPYQGKLDVGGLYDFLGLASPDVIVYEQFEHRPKRFKGNVLFPRELIGIINLYTGQHSEIIVTPQMPARKEEHFKKKERIKELGLWLSNLDHGMDALRHFLMWWNFGRGYEFNKGQELRLIDITKDSITR